MHNTKAFDRGPLWIASRHFAMSRSCTPPPKAANYVDDARRLRAAAPIFVPPYCTYV
jgi:hypothetical protein